MSEKKDLTEADEKVLDEFAQGMQAKDNNSGEIIEFENWDDYIEWGKGKLKKVYVRDIKQVIVMSRKATGQRVKETVEKMISQEGGVIESIERKPTTEKEYRKIKIREAKIDALKEFWEEFKELEK